MRENDSKACHLSFKVVRLKIVPSSPRNPWKNETISLFCDKNIFQFMAQIFLLNFVISSETCNENEIFGHMVAYLEA